MKDDIAGSFISLMMDTDKVSSHKSILMWHLPHPQNVILVYRRTHI
jgi:hypothetical protein